MPRRRVRLSPIDRRRFVGLCAGSLALAAAGCRRRDDPAYARDNTLVLAIHDASEMKPDAEDLDFLYCPRLAEIDENGDLQPLLAQSWEHSPDYLEWTYHLRTDARWSDGVPVTAHDVKFTLDLLSHPDVHQYVFDAVTVVDDYTVKIRAGHVLNGGAQDDISYFPRHVLEHLEPKKFWDWDYWLHPTVSAGPYRFVRYVPETMMEFEANPHYFLGRPRIERLVYKFVGEAGLNELLSGNVDIATGDPTQIAFVAEDPRFRVYQKLTAGGMAIYWKCDHALFRDVRVRRALTLAIDRRALLGVINLPSDLPITDGVFTTRQFLRRQLPEPLPYDPVQAVALLEAAGWQDRDGDGVREREGQPFRFTALVRNRERFDRLAVYVQAQLRRVGVQMEVQVLDLALVWDRLRGGDFEAVLDIHASLPFAQQRYFGRDNPIGYQNPEVFRLTDQVVATPNPDELDPIYRALTEIVRAELPVTRLVPLTNTTFAHRRVRGLTRAGQLYDIEDLWLETEP